jgi:peptide/nickel transport system substrate-binding protein
MIAPSNAVWFDATKVPCTAYDPKHAKALVARSGFASPTVHLLTRDGTDNLRAAQFIQAQEAAVGINVVIEVADTTAELARARSGDFDTRLNGWAPGSADPHKNTFQFLATTGVRNYSGYSNPRMDLILANGVKATTFEARSKLYRTAQQILVTDRPVIPLYSLISFAGTGASVTGVRLFDNGAIDVEHAQFK